MIWLLNKIKEEKEAQITHIKNDKGDITKSMKRKQLFEKSNFN